LGSGDDEDDDNDMEDASAETENDQVYFSRGTRQKTPLSLLCLPLHTKEIETP